MRFTLWERGCIILERRGLGSRGEVWWMCYTITIVSAGVGATSNRSFFACILLP